MTLRRIVLDFSDEVLLVRCMYERADPVIPGPNTKARTKEVTQIARSGLTQALEALEASPGRH